MADQPVPPAMPGTMPGALDPNNKPVVVERKPSRLRVTHPTYTNEFRIPDGKGHVVAIGRGWTEVSAASIGAFTEAAERSGVILEVEADDNGDR